MILDIYKKHIQAVQKNIDFGDFVRDICSWYPMKMYNYKGKISIYPENDRHAPIIDDEQFEAGREALPSRKISGKINFFEEFGVLFRSISLPGFHHYYGAENAAYSNHVSSTSHAYSSFHVTGDCERVMYSLSTKIHAKNIYSSIMSWIYSENVYQSLGVIHSMNIFYSKYIQDSHDVWFSSDMIGCSECICCSGLQNTSYAIENVIYDREEYLIRKKAILDNRSLYEQYRTSLKGIGVNTGSNNTTGKYCIKSENIQNGYYSIHVKDGKNILFTGHPDGLSDVYNSIFVSAGRGYYGACAVGGDSSEIYNCISMMRSFECYYSYFLERCSFCFGCIGLKNKSYCILNQQYTKEEWYEKVASIMENMKTEGTLGSFFPATLNPFYFDDTLAGAIQQDIDPALPGYNGFLFSSQQSSNSSMYSQPLLATQLSQYQKYNADGTSTISRELLPKVIQDTDGKYYTFQNMEIEFYERYGLPLPTKHWMTRIIENFQ